MTLFYLSRIWNRIIITFIEALFEIIWDKTERNQDILNNMKYHTDYLKGILGKF